MCLSLLLRYASRHHCGRDATCRWLQTTQVVSGTQSPVACKYTGHVSVNMTLDLSLKEEV